MVDVEALDVPSISPIVVGSQFASALWYPGKQVIMMICPRFKDLKTNRPAALKTRIRLVDSETMAIGSSGVDPGRSLENIGTCSTSLIDDSLDVEENSSCDCQVLSSSSILEIHRMTDTAV